MAEERNEDEAAAAGRSGGVEERIRLAMEESRIERDERESRRQILASQNQWLK
jgi:hypothetical protein